jgi:hypothetical protein
VEGICDLINHLLMAIFEHRPKAALLPRLSTALEPVNLDYADVIEHLRLEARLPDVFQDYAFIQAGEGQAGKGQPGEGNAAQATALNLQVSGVPDISAESILREFYRVLSLIVQKYLADDRLTFQYARFKKSSEYQQYQTATALLQNFDIALITRPEASLAFWLNLYNFLVIDGVLHHGITASVRERQGFFSAVRYRLGDYVFSLDDIAHGILRHNQRRPYTFAPPFGATDPRRAFCLEPLEPGIHCCLVHGTVSSPGLRLYTPRQCSAQVSQAITQFLQSPRGMRIDVRASKVWLNRVFYWYRRDFERDGRDLLDVVIEHIDAPDLARNLSQNRSQLTLRFLDYDWGLNAS